MTDGLTASDVALLQGNNTNNDGMWGNDASITTAKIGRAIN